MTTTTQNNTPAETIRDRDIKITFWKNESEKGSFYSGEPGRTFTDKATGEVKSARSFSGTDWLRLGQLCFKAYERSEALKKQDAQAAEQAAA